MDPSLLLYEYVLMEEKSPRSSVSEEGVYPCGVSCLVHRLYSEDRELASPIQGDPLVRIRVGDFK